MAKVMTQLAICAGVLLTYMGMAHLDAQPDRRQEQIDAKAQDAALLALEQERRRNRAARDICGNAAYEWVDDTTMLCVPRNGGKQFNATIKKP